MNRYEMIDGALVAAAVETKTFADVERVIVAGKPAAVTDRFIEMYLLSTDPYQAVKDEWYTVCNRLDELAALTADQTTERPGFDEQGEPVTETVVVREARNLTESEIAEVGSLTERQVELTTGLRTETYDAALEAWDGSGDQPEPDMQARDIALEAGYPWLATDTWPEHAVDLEQWKLQNYSLLRRAGYGSIEDQLDKMYHGTWADHVAAVKAAAPKPEPVA